MRTREVSEGAWDPWGIVAGERFSGPSRMLFPPASAQEPRTHGHQNEEEEEEGEGAGAEVSLPRVRGLPPPHSPKCRACP